jgi:hypothetical protein
MSTRSEHLRQLASRCALKAAAAKDSAARASLEAERAEEDWGLVEADQRFQAALEHAIATGSERIEAVEATVQLKRHTTLSL